MLKQIGKVRMVTLLAFSVVIAGVFFHLGENRGRQSGLVDGYVNDQVSFATEIYAVLNETIDTNSPPQSYRHFKDVKDITLYVVTRNGVKTIAIWRGGNKKSSANNSESDANVNSEKKN